MIKYIQVFKISFQQEFVYRLNFIMWRVRNVMQIFLVFFLWDSVFSNPNRVVFGYDRSKILTYVFGLLFIKALVLSARAVDVGGEIFRGDISNYLLKPINYFKYWLTRDISSKGLNLIFAFFEALFLYIFLKPPIFIQTNPVILLIFLISIILAILIFFNIIFILNSVSFWIPEATWGFHFLIIVIILEFTSGTLFPLDILPLTIQKIFYFLPFPYIIFFPLQIYLGKITGIDVLKVILTSFIWSFFLWIIMNSIWKKGLKVYQAYGK